jgi:hypothetical protein
MALKKQTVNIDFSQGLDQKSDPNQIPIGKFTVLKNKIFNKFKLLTKRFGFGSLISLPNTTSKFLTTFNGNLTALGTSLYSLSEGAGAWFNKGSFQAVDLGVQPLVRANTTQNQCDAAVASNGLVCTVYTDVAAGSTTYKYSILDSSTGQNVVSPTTMATCNGSPRVWVIGNYFVIVYPSTTAANLEYIGIPFSNPSSPGSATTLVTNYLAAGTQGAFEGVVTNNVLYVAYNASDGGGAIRVIGLNYALATTGSTIFAGRVATMLSVCADESAANPVIYISIYTTVGPAGYVFAINQIFTTILTPTSFIAAGTLLNLASTATSGVCTIYYETSTTYSYDGSINTNIVSYKTVTQAGAVSSATVLQRSVGIASKAILYNGVSYLMVCYSSATQPTYFLINKNGLIISKLAYSNGGGYLTKGLPLITNIGTTLQFVYLIKDLLEPVNKNQNASSSSAVYTQTGINLATYDFDTTISTGEIGHNLHMSGGELWMYDGTSPVEHGFHVWPDYVETTTATVGGSLTAQIYYYMATYEWTDNQGNIHRSAPSIPVKRDISGSGTSTNTNTINVPTLRLTSKTNVKICIYRWSTAQQTFYQVTSVSSPTFSSISSDSIAFTDTFADSSIIGNSIIYTTGGVIENIGAPAAKAIALYKSRLFLIPAENRNLLWYSKQVIENTPVEMSDLFTLFVAPTTGAHGDTGFMECLSAMDDKLIMFKPSAIYYLVGTGPDNAGTNNDFTDPVFITSTVGCANQNSIVFIPNGLMFQSDKGIWLLGRDLTTSYIGAPVEDFNSYTVLSAVAVPGTNQARFTLSNGVVLVYDYFFDQWSTFYGINNISATLYEGKHTVLNQYGNVLQETSDTYLDGSRPVTIELTTGWINVADLQGYQRAYFMNILGNYVSPHTLTVKIAYDYNDTPTQTTVITPLQTSTTYGSDSIYGGSSVLGGLSSVEKWRVYFENQKCEAFKVTIIENYDSTSGVTAGAGLTLSGLNLVVGVKRGYSRLPAAQSV